MGAAVSRWPSELLDRAVSYLHGRTAETMIQIRADYGGPIDVQRLAEAACLALVAEPILACRFVEHRLAPYWEPVEISPCEAFREVHSANAIEAFELEPIPPAEGPRLRICAWNAPHGARVVFKICHLACDATGAKAAVALVTEFYRRLEHEPDFQPRPRSSERGIAELLAVVPSAALPALYASALPDLARPSPQALAIPAGPATGLRFIEREIGTAQVERLRRYTKARTSTLNDLLLTAFARTLAAESQWDGSKPLSITSTVDYRRYLSVPPRSPANLSTTVMGFPDLGTELGDTFSDTLTRVSAITRVAKDGWLGIGSLVVTLLLLGHMRHGLARGLMQDGLDAGTRSGQLENGLGNNGPLLAGDLALNGEPVRACMLPSPFYPPQFVVDVSGYAGSLTLILGAFDAQHAAAERFIDAMADELAAVAQSD